MYRLYLKTIVNIAKQTAPAMTLFINNGNREIVNYIDLIVGLSITCISENLKREVGSISR